MSDEIKEILDKAKEISGYGSDGKQHTRMFNQFEAKALLDYITNLQEENKQLEKNADSRMKTLLKIENILKTLPREVCIYQEDLESKGE